MLACKLRCENQIIWKIATDCYAKFQGRENKINENNFEKAFYLS